MGCWDLIGGKKKKKVEGEAEGRVEWECRAGLDDEGHQLRAHYSGEAGKPACREDVSVGSGP